MLQIDLRIAICNHWELELLITIFLFTDLLIWLAAPLLNLQTFLRIQVNWLPYLLKLLLDINWSLEASELILTSF
jgi:hypothetical protein